MMRRVSTPVWQLQLAVPRYNDALVTLSAVAIDIMTDAAYTRTLAESDNSSPLSRHA